MFYNLYSNGDRADTGTNTCHIEPMLPITTSFQLPTSSSSSSVLSARCRGTASPPRPGLVASSLGRRSSVARDPAASCGVVTTDSAAAGVHLRRNSFAVARPRPDQGRRPPTTGCDVTIATGSYVTEGGRALQCGGRRQPIQHEHCRFGIGMELLFSPQRVTVEKWRGSVICAGIRAPTFHFCFRRYCI